MSGRGARWLIWAWVLGAPLAGCATDPGAEDAAPGVDVEHGRDGGADAGAADSEAADSEAADSEAADAAAADAEASDAEAADAEPADGPTPDANLDAGEGPDGAVSDAGANPQLAAELIAFRIDQPLAANQVARSVVVMRNSGSLPWVGPGFSLVNTTAPLWALGEVALDGGEIVAPGGFRMFELLITAPSAPGTHAVEFQMSDDDVLFGAVASALVFVVTGPTYAVREGDPEYWECGSTRGLGTLCGVCPNCSGARDYDATFTGSLPWPFPFYGQTISQGTSVDMTSYGTAAFGDATNPASALPIPSALAPSPLLVAIGVRSGFWASHPLQTSLVVGPGGEALQPEWPRIVDTNGMQRGSVAIRLYRSGIIETEAAGFIGGQPMGFEDPTGTVAITTPSQRAVFLPSWRSFAHPADLVLISADYPRLVEPGQFADITLTFLNIGETDSGPLEALIDISCRLTAQGGAFNTFSVPAGQVATLQGAFMPDGNGLPRCITFELPRNVPGVYANTVQLDPVYAGYPDAGVPDAAPVGPDAGFPPVDAGWTTVDPTGAPLARSHHTAVWTGAEMIIFGGSGVAGTLGDGAAYRPSTDTWRTISSNGAPSPRAFHTAVWTGTEMIVWGGVDSARLSDGARYDPSTDTWTSMASAAGVPPAARSSHSAVWVRDRMLIWGGFGQGGGTLGDGFFWDEPNDAWNPLASAGAPSARGDHRAVFTGSAMLIWGGETGGGAVTNTGAALDTNTYAWQTIPIFDSPAARSQHSAVWSGAEMLIWGGRNTTTELASGARYDPVLRSWTAIGNAGTAPAARTLHTSVWSGAEMLVFGGADGATFLDGERYDPALDVWSQLPGGPVGRFSHTAVMSPFGMIVWGGAGALGLLNDGARYSP